MVKRSITDSSSLVKARVIPENRLPPESVVLFVQDTTKNNITNKTRLFFISLHFINY